LNACACATLLANTSADAATHIAIDFRMTVSSFFSVARDSDRPPES
jgi:hypothetical protein